MLKVLFGRELENLIESPSVYFDNIYENSWFDDEIVKEIVRDIDKSEVNGLCVLSPFLGSIPIEKISGGAKTLILMYELDDFIFDLIHCGNNCEDWIIKISNEKDITVCMTGFDMMFSNKSIRALCLNDNSVINGSAEWCKKMSDFGRVYYEG